MIECKEHQQGLNPKLAPYTDYQSTNLVKSFNDDVQSVGWFRVSTSCNERAGLNSTLSQHGSPSPIWMTYLGESINTFQFKIKL